MQYTVADAAEILGLSVRRTQYLVLALALGQRIMGGNGKKPVAYLLDESDITTLRNRKAAITEEAQ